MNTAVVYTLNDQSKPSSSRITLFGNPNDYAWRLTNLSAYGTNFPIYLKSQTSMYYDFFHAVATDIQTTRIYYSNNALAVVAYSPIYSNDTNSRYFFAPPISKRVIFAVVSSS